MRRKSLSMFNCRCENNDRSNLLGKTYMLIIAILLSVNFANAQFSGGGTGTNADPFKIVTAADLAMVRNFVGSAHTEYFVLMNNVNLNGDNWIPIGISQTATFMGHLDGKGYKVQGLYINSSDYQYAGLFGYNKGVIQNLNVEGSGITNDYSSINDSYTGGLVGYNNGGYISNCSIALDVAGNLSYYNSLGSSYVGGLIGYNIAGSIIDCSTTGTFVATAIGNYFNSISGGLIGYSNGGSISGCYTSGNVSGYTKAGGLIGSNNNKGSGITGCHSNATVSCDWYSGGLIGENDGSINTSYSTGNSSGACSGGLIGTNAGNIEKCYAAGNSSSSSSSVSSYISPSSYTPYSGGLIGYNSGAVSNCYATGNSSSSYGYTYTLSFYSYSGGLIGYNTNAVSNCYATGTSTATNVYSVSYAINGAVIGYNNGGNLSQCYYNTDANGTLPAIGSGGGTAMGLTSAGMKAKSIFVGWNFDTIWDIVEGVTYPFLMDMIPPAGTNVIGGRYSVCNGSTSDYLFEDGKSIYYWTVAGGTVNSGQGTNHITVQWGMDTGAGSVSLNYGTGTANKDVQIVALPPLPISGNTKPDAGSSENYSVANGQSSYTWTVEGGEITAGQSTSSITVSWYCNAAQRSLSLTYSNADGCSAVSEMSIIANEVHPSIIGTMNAVSNDTPVIYITEASKSDYVWTVANGVIQSGQGTPSISVLWDDVSNLTNGHIAVNYTNAKGCRASVATDSIVSIHASNDAALASLAVNTGILTPAFNANVTNYTVSVPFSAASITVSATPHHASATVTGAGVQTLNEGANALSITVTAKDGTTKTYTVTVTRETDTGINEIKSAEIKIYPNPVKNELFIKSDLQIKKVEIYSLTGDLLQNESNFNGKISVSKLLKGVYIVKIYIDKGLVVRKIVKE